MCRAISYLRASRSIDGIPWPLWEARTGTDTWAWMIQDLSGGARDVQVLLRSTLIYGVVPSRSAIQSQILVPWRPSGLISRGAIW